MSTTELEATGADAPPAGEWELDPGHSDVSFTARYMMLSKVRGKFGSFAGTLVIGSGPEDSRVEVTINADSIDTGNEMRDGHLRSPDFMDVERFPTLSFRSTKVDQTGPATLRVAGDLTIKDVTRPVALEVRYEGFTQKDLFGKSRVAFSAHAEIDRDEFGITWNQALETGGVLVGKTVGIDLDVQAVRPAEEAAA